MAPGQKRGYPGLQPRRHGLLRQQSKAEAATVSLVCSNCGYGIAIRREPPPCPMCRHTSWEPGPWRPFTSIQDVTIARAAATARTALADD